MSARSLHRVAFYSQEAEVKKAKAIFAWKGWAEGAASARKRALSALGDAWEAVTAAHGAIGAAMPDAVTTARVTVKPIKTPYAQYAIGTEWRLSRELMTIARGAKRTKAHRPVEAKALDAIAATIAACQLGTPVLRAWGSDVERGDAIEVTTANSGDKVPASMAPSREIAEVAAMAMALHLRTDATDRWSNRITKVDSGEPQSSATLRAASAKAAAKDMPMAIATLRSLGLGRVADQVSTIDQGRSPC